MGLRALTFIMVLLSISSFSEALDTKVSCTLAKPLDTVTANFCQKECCNSEWDHPSTFFICSKEGKCCNPEGCECGIYEEIAHGDSCPANALEIDGTSP